MTNKLWASLAAIMAVGIATACGPQKPRAAIVCAVNASSQECLAAAELRRYVYLRTDAVLPIVQQDSLTDAGRDALIVGTKGRPLPATILDKESRNLVENLGPEEYLIRTVSDRGRSRIMIVGGSPAGVLYGAYRYIEEALGVRFYLHGDVVPDKKVAFALPAVNLQAKPLFPIRGIQPFHDFPEGPDWWNADEYKAVLAQLPKLGMNFIGLHTYPEGGPNAEPMVWIGPRSEIGAGSQVAASYPSSWQNTMRGNWGYEAKKTGDFHFGASQLFDEDAFGADIMKGLTPEPKTPEEANTLFERAGRMLGDVFAFASALNIKTCLGTETPLTIPAWVQKRLRAQGLNPNDPKVVKTLYLGMFERLAQTSRPDYYWLWTFEGWTWSDASHAQVRSVAQDLGLAVQAAKEIHAPFQLATCGWVLGPPSDRTLFDRILPKEVTLSCINREVGKAPVDVNFSRISGRSKWAIPWLEDDPSLTSPQLWAGRMRRDAADALAYGCDGLLGIHWRTRILSPNILALALAAWEQKSWNPAPVNLETLVGPLNGVYASFPDKDIAGTDEDAVYRDVRDKVFGYHLPVPNGKYNVTLKFSDGQMDKPGQRVFDVSIEGKKALERLDIIEAAGKFTKLDFSFLNISVTDGRLDIDFADRIGYPCVAGIVVQGPKFIKKINCGGPAVLGYEADWPETPRYAPVSDFYQDWARNQFGDAAADAIAALFARLDGKLRIPVDWVGGPGGLKPDSRPWTEAAKDYVFVDELTALRPKIAGRGNLDRFDYWLKTFQYMREVAHLDCLAAEYARDAEEIKKVSDNQAQGLKAKETLLPLRIKIVAQVRSVFDNLLPTVGTTGELGTVANWEQHILPPLLEKPGQELEALLGEKLPPEASLSSDYNGTPRIFVLTSRSSVLPGETLTLKTIFLGRQKPEEIFLFWRTMGRGDFSRLPLEHVARGVYRAQIPGLNGDIEYYVKARAEGREILFPPTAPELNQTVVVMKANF